MQNPPTLERMSTGVFGVRLVQPRGFLLLVFSYSSVSVNNSAYINDLVEFYTAGRGYRGGERGIAYAHVSYNEDVNLVLCGSSASSKPFSMHFSASAFVMAGSLKSFWLSCRLC